MLFLRAEALKGEWWCDVKLQQIRREDSPRTRWHSPSRNVHYQDSGKRYKCRAPGRALYRGYGSTFFGLLVSRIKCERDESFSRVLARPINEKECNMCVEARFVSHTSAFKKEAGRGMLVLQ